MRQTLTLTTLLLIITLAFTPMVAAQAPGNSTAARPAANAKSFVAERGVGRKVKVKLLDGTKTAGMITRIGDNSFELATEKGRQPLVVEYNNVAEVKKAGWSTGAKIALGIGIGVAAAVTVLVVAVANADLGDAFP